LLSWIITIRQASLQAISWCCEKLKAVDRTQVNSAARPICPGELTTLVLGVSTPTRRVLFPASSGPDTLRR
jgi:hypothetical protein